MMKDHHFMVASSDISPLAKHQPDQPKAVIFDAFGTLLQIQEGRHPYRRLIKLGIEQGRRPQPGDSRRIMTNPWGLRDVAEAFGIEVPESLMQELETDLVAEVAGVEPYTDALDAVATLQETGMAISVCSNLAMPYAMAIKRHFPTLEAVYSFAVGTMKPEPQIYGVCCQLLAVRSGEAVMVGDSLQCDCIGPGTVGIRGHHLDRVGGQGQFSDLMQFTQHILQGMG
jgi:FMN phosphatase YigB (HAD superfamily)